MTEQAQASDRSSGFTPEPDPEDDGVPRPVPRARWVLWFTGGYILLAWTAAWAVDVWDVAGLQQALAEWDPHWPYLWYHLYSENGLTEWLQWLFLGGLAVTAGAIAGISSARGDRRAMAFWRLLALGAVLMLMEDAGNVRHRLSEYAMAAWTDHGDWPRVYTELAFFSVVAAAPVYALLRHHRAPRRLATCWRLLLAGFFVYGVAAAASGTRNVRNWYQHAGTWLDQVVLGGRLERVGHGRWGLGYDDPTGFILFDTVIEEAVELIGVTLLLAAALAYLRALQLAVTEPPGPAADDTGQPPPVQVTAQSGGQGG